MVRLIIPELLPSGPKAGVHIARIAEVKEKVAESGNVVWRISARFVDKSRLTFYVTFAPSEKAQRLVAFFARSLDLILPGAPGAQVDLRPEDIQGRLFFCTVELDSEGAPRITKFLRKDEAFAINPALSNVAVAPQEPRTIRAVETEGL
jgi:hypothetical protein